jgi:hypothetical protein
MSERDRCFGVEGKGSGRESRGNLEMVRSWKMLVTTFFDVASISNPCFGGCVAEVVDVLPKLRGLRRHKSKGNQILV